VSHLLLDRLDGTHGFMGIEVNGELSTNSPDIDKMQHEQPSSPHDRRL